MRSFRDLVTEQKETVVFTFGRFNPPTTGHEKLLDKVKQIAGSSQPKMPSSPQKKALLAARS